MHSQHSPLSQLFLGLIDEIFDDIYTEFLEESGVNLDTDLQAILRQKSKNWISSIVRIDEGHILPGEELQSALSFRIRLRQEMEGFLRAILPDVSLEVENASPLTLQEEGIPPFPSSFTDLLLPEPGNA